MTGNLYTTGTYQADHTRFGGFIYPSDFYTDYRRKSHASSSAIANRIANDIKFDVQCRNNIVKRQNYGGNKNA